MRFIIAIMGFLCVTGVWAEESVSVVERMSCAEISARISELSAVEDATEEITKLKAEYRRNCVRSAASRRTSASGRVIIEGSFDDVQNVDNTEEEQIDVIENVVTSDVISQDAESEMSLEQELANLDAGLCADGSEPNKFGCCGDELFKDLGDTVFACCPKDGGDCFPPLK